MTDLLARHVLTFQELNANKILEENSSSVPMESDHHDSTLHTVQILQTIQQVRHYRQKRHALFAHSLLICMYIYMYIYGSGIRIWNTEYGVWEYGVDTQSGLVYRVSEDAAR